MRPMRLTEKAKRLLFGWSSWIAVVVIFFFLGHLHVQVTNLELALALICVVTFAVVYVIIYFSSEED